MKITDRILAKLKPRLEAAKVLPGQPLEEPVFEVYAIENKPPFVKLNRIFYELSSYNKETEAKYAPTRKKITDVLKNFTDENVSALDVLEILKHDDEAWCALSSINGYNDEKFVFALNCIKNIEKYITDQKLLNALRVVENKACGLTDSVEAINTHDEIKEVFHGYSWYDGGTRRINFLAARAILNLFSEVDIGYSLKCLMHDARNVVAEHLRHGDNDNIDNHNSDVARLISDAALPSDPTKPYITHNSYDEINDKALKDAQWFSSVQYYENEEARTSPEMLRKMKELKDAELKFQVNAMRKMLQHIARMERRVLASASARTDSSER
ncbi:MAG: hypothetical protein FWD15_03750 [Alphaproteobacteria bacterium]|nr:hypothetical protein [Alphaproteobacteria bacterium]